VVCVGTGPAVDRKDRWSALSDRLKVWLPDLLVALVLLLAGVSWRWELMVHQPLFFDNVDPFLRAHAWTTDWILAFSGHSQQTWYELLWPASAPWLRQFGPALAWLYVPFVVGASGLQAAVQRRLVVQALMALVLYGGLRRTFGQHAKNEGRGDLALPWPEMLAALAAALTLGFTCEPFGMMSIGDETYLAPDLCVLVSVAVAGILLADSRRMLYLGFGALPVAAMLHPLAVCYAPGLLLVAHRVWRKGDRRIVLESLAIGALFSVPEAIHLADILLEHGDLSWVAETVGVGAQAGSPLAPVVASWQAFIELEPFPVGPLLLLAPVAVLTWVFLARPPGAEGAGQQADADLRAGAAWLSVFTLLCLLFLLGLGAGLGILRPYHWRIALPAMTLQLGLAVYLLARWFQRRVCGLEKMLRLGLPLLVAVPLALLVLIRASDTLERTGPWNGDVKVHRWMAEVLQHDAGDRKRWFEAVVLGYKDHPFSWVSGPALFLEQRMMGVPRGRFCLDGWLYLAVNGHIAHTGAVRQQMGWDEEALAAWSSVVGAGTRAQHGPPLPARDRTDVHLVGRYQVNPEYAILLVRLEDYRASRAWSGWLFEQLPPEQVQLMLDANYYLPLSMPEFAYHYAAMYFDPRMVQEHYH